MLPENREALSSGRFGELLFAAGREGARCYIEAATASWAIGERRDLLTTSEATTAALRATISRQAAAEQAMTTELSLALRQRQGLEEQLTAVLSSSSWRMTALLRTVVRLLRGERPAGPGASPTPPGL